MDDLLIDPAGSEIVALAEIRMREALIVAEIQVGLGAIVGDVDLAMLERAHGAGIDVQIRVELLQRHAQPATLEQAPDGRGRNAFTKRRNNSTRLRICTGHWHSFCFSFR